MHAWARAQLLRTRKVQLLRPFSPPWISRLISLSLRRVWSFGQKEYAWKAVFCNRVFVLFRRSLYSFLWIGGNLALRGLDHQWYVGITLGLLLVEGVRSQLCLNFIISILLLLWRTQLYTVEFVVTRITRILTLQTKQPWNATRLPYPTIKSSSSS